MQRRNIGGLKNQGNTIIKIYYVIIGNLFSPHQSNKNKDRKISFKIVTQHIKRNNLKFSYSES